MTLTETLIAFVLFIATRIILAIDDHLNGRT